MFLFGDVLPSVNLVTPIFRIVFVEMICVCFLLYVKETFRMGSVFFFSVCSLLLQQSLYYYLCFINIFFFLAHYYTHTIR